MANGSSLDGSQIDTYNGVYYTLEITNVCLAPGVAPAFVALQKRKVAAVLASVLCVRLVFHGLCRSCRVPPAITAYNPLPFEITSKTQNLKAPKSPPC